MHNISLLLFDIQETMKLLGQRGPDLQGQHTVRFPGEAELEFRGHVLWQQGDAPCLQPIVEGKHVMLLNGDIYNKPFNPAVSDTQWLFDQLTKFNHHSKVIYSDGFSIKTN